VHVKIASRIVSYRIAQINGVAVDWVTKNIYWADGLHRMIGVKPLLRYHRVWKAIVDSDLSTPQDVAVNPQHQ